MVDNARYRIPEDSVLDNPVFKYASMDKHTLYLTILTLPSPVLRCFERMLWFLVMPPTLDQCPIPRCQFATIPPQ